MTHSAGSEQAADYSVIKECRGCGSTKLSEILAFGLMPLADGLLDSPEHAAKEVQYPLTVVFCEDCTLVQILENVRPDILYCQDYPYFSSVSPVWLQHCRDNALELIETRQLNSDSLVLEVACNDGYLLKNFAEAGIPTLGIDPAEGPVAEARKAGIEVHQTFFTEEFAQELADSGVSCDVMLGNNVLAHVPDQRAFARGVATLLKKDGVAVIEFPYVRDLIDKCAFDTIYHEHHCYFSVTSVRHLFATAGLHVNDVRRLSTHGGSLRIFVEHEDRPTEAMKALLAEEQELGVDCLDFYHTFADRVRATEKELNRLVTELREQGKTVAAYGAAAKGTTLLNASRVGSNLLDFVVDQNHHKHGRLMPGVHLPIYPTAHLAESRPDYTVMLAWNLKDEIMSQQTAYTQAGGKFIIPVPQPQVVE